MQEKIIKNIKEALAEFIVEDLDMENLCRHRLTVGSQEKVYTILDKILNDCSSSSNHLDKE